MKEKTEKQLKKERKLKAERTFPVGHTILLVLILLAQVGLIFLGIRYQPKPQDVIHQYNVTVQPREDGSLDIEYRLVWEALDTSEELTWVEIGMANERFSVYPDSVTPNIRQYSTYTDDDYVSLRLDFAKAYIGGDVIEFSFKINQKDMLCKNESGYFYEFVPGWFNEIQVEQYEFLWKTDGVKDYVRRGSLDYGEYSVMTVQYGQDDFYGCRTVKYEPFEDGGAYNALKEDKGGIVVLCCMGAGLLILAEVYVIDCYVSYARGRGFMTEYGHHVHMYGRTNPHYIRARDRHLASNPGGRSGGRGGGCACACACACAGGGRAGCSQKDTYSVSDERRNETASNAFQKDD